jgi:hypothetical protein
MSHNTPNENMAELLKFQREILDVKFETLEAEFRKSERENERMNQYQEFSDWNTTFQKTQERKRKINSILDEQ